jgi:hypothetical protein
MSLDKFKGVYIPLLDWFFFEDQQEIDSYRKAYLIKNSYKILGIDSLGNIIAKNGKNYLLIDHEEPILANEEFLTKNNEKLVLLLDQILLAPLMKDIDQVSNIEDIKELKKFKKLVKAFKKNAPKKMKFLFENAIEEIDWQIDFIID